MSLLTRSLNCTLSPAHQAQTVHAWWTKAFSVIDTCLWYARSVKTGVYHFEVKNTVDGPGKNLSSAMSLILHQRHNTMSAMSQLSLLLHGDLAEDSPTLTNVKKDDLCEIEALQPLLWRGTRLDKCTDTCLSWALICVYCSYLHASWTPLL